MSLHDILTEMRARRKTVTVYGADPRDDLEALFDTRNVTVVHQSLPDEDTEGFLVVSDEHGYLGSVGLRAVRHLLEPTYDAALCSTHESAAFRCLLELLDDTVFTSLDKRQLLAASREIEDRAWRLGRGELHTGFQSLAAMRAQVPVYSQLGSRTELDVHVYGTPEWIPETLHDVWIYPVESEEIGRYWFVAYDGGDDDLNACALLAVEVGSQRFEGFWTYDPAVVATLVDYISETYGPKKVE
ncbi:DICT sensory domain-containing protein [Haloarchaeobius sp. DFWS5]|uniref:DICT sensory domain-containing protein n=1 Tax=Haloarchaeobius sp. DFWS5 TaxID=3446114 RepID=UPI003EBB36E7